MKSQARVVVIGGGVNGVSVLYHLARKGWTDVVLLERDGAHGGVDVARGRSPASLQHELFGRSTPSIFGGTLQNPGGRDRPGRGAARQRQSPPGDQPRPHGRISQLPVHGGDHRRRMPPHRGRRDRETLAALRHGGPGRRALASDRRAHRSGRPHHGHGARCPRQGRRNPSADRGDGGSSVPTRSNGSSRRREAMSVASTSCARPAITPARPRAGWVSKSPPCPSSTSTSSPTRCRN